MELYKIYMKSMAYIYSRVFTFYEVFSQVRDNLSSFGFKLYAQGYTATTVSVSPAVRAFM